MYSNIEIEAKVLLSKYDYEKVYKALNMDYASSYTQVNYYIESKDSILKKNDVALSIREKKGEYVLTLKTPLSEGLLEKKQSLRPKEALEMISLNRFPLGGIREFLEILDIDTDTLFVKAKLTTLRSEIENPSDEEIISMDSNTYGNKVDYELEVDKSAMILAKQRIDSILRPLGIDYEFNTKSKGKRALEEIEKSK